MMSDKVCYEPYHGKEMIHDGIFVWVICLEEGDRQVCFRRFYATENDELFCDENGEVYKLVNGQIRKSKVEDYAQI